MTNFKIGDKVRVIDQFRITRRLPEVQIITGKHGQYWELDNITGLCNGWADHELIKLENNMDNLQQGDKIKRTDGWGDEVIYTFQGYVGDVLIVIDEEGAATLFGKEEGDFSVVTEEETTELTLKEVAEKFDIDVDKLRIKE